MADKEKLVESFAAKVAADEELQVKIASALEARDAATIVSIAAELGFEFEESDFEVADKASSEVADKAISIDELESVAGGQDVVVIHQPTYLGMLMNEYERARKGKGRR